MSANLGFLLVERRFKATCLKTLLGPGWNVVSISGCLPEQVFTDDVCQVTPPRGARLAVPEALLALRTQIRLAPRVLIATDPTVIGEVAAQFIADILKLEEAQKIDLLELSPAGLDAAIARARPINQKYLSQYRHDRRHSQLIRFALKRMRANVAGRDEYVPEKTERALLDLIVERDRHERIATHARSERMLLQCDGFTADAIDARAADALQSGRRLKARVVSCVTLALQEPAPPPLDFANLVRVAATRLGLSPIEVHDRAYQLYLRGLVTWPLTASMKLDAKGLEAARHVAQIKQLPLHGDVASTDSHLAIGRPCAIRPVDLDQEICGTPALQGIYSLIHERTMLSVLSASMMKTRHIVLEVDAPAGSVRFEAKGQQAMAYGWRLVAGARFSQDGLEPKPFLPLFNAGDRVSAEVYRDIAPSGAEVLRLSERDLLDRSESRPQASPDESIRALRNLINADYVREQKGYLVPTSFGVAVAQLFAQQRRLTTTADAAQDLPRPELTLVEI